MPAEESFPAESAPDSPAQDIVWMGRIKQGDAGALRELVEAHQYRVIGTIARMLGDTVEAEDLAQQVFIRVWKSAPRYEPTARFTTWLFTITRNLVFNELRRRQRQRTQPLESSAEGEPPAAQAADPTAKPPDRTMLDDELQNAIQAAIEELPETQRMAIVLRRYDEFSYEQIGEVLQLTVPAVKSVLFRARTELREKLRAYLEE